MPAKDVEKGKPELGRRPSKKGSNSSDSSGPLFSMYSETAETEDNTMAERWSKDADGILIFAGLFSAAVASFLTLSIPILIPNSQDISAFYLQNIYQNLADPNVSVPSTEAAPPTFSPPRYAVRVNLLWVFSLGISLTCAIMATMLQQWARQYIAFTQLPRGSPKDRARTRALFAGSVDKLFIKTMGILLACYLHLAILLFFLGLLIFFHNVNHTIFINILWFFGFCMTIYTFFTVLPYFQSCSLLYTPVSVLPGTFVVLSTCLIHSTPFANRFRFRRWILDWLFEGVDKVEDLSSTRIPTPEIDARILELTLNSLSEDDAMERSFAAIPDLFDDIVDLPSSLRESLQEAFKGALYRFLDCTLRSNTVVESTKNSRLITCLKASNVVLDPNRLRQFLQDILNGNWPELLRSVEMGHSLRSFVDRSDEENVSYLQKIISHIVENAEKRDDRWLALAADQPDSTKRAYNEDVSLSIHRIQSVPLHNPVLVSGTRPFDMPMSQPYTPANPSSLLARQDGPHVPTGTSSSNIAAVDAGQGNIGISASNINSYPIFSREVASQQSGSILSRSTVNDARVPPPFADSAVTQSGYLHSSYAQGFASLSPPAATPHISPQVISDLEPRIITSISTLHVHNDTLDQNILLPMEISRHPSNAPSTPNIAANILWPGDSQQGRNQS